MFISPSVQDLQLTHNVLALFQDCSGLGCNLAKYQMAPIRCSDDQVTLATNIFPCQMMNFPIKYLRIPLSVTKLSRSALQKLLDKVANKLPIWKGKLIHRSGRLTLIKTTMSAITVYTSISMGLLGWLLKQFRKIMLAFLWTGTDMVQSGKCLVSWCRIKRPLHLDKLGAIDLRLLGMALCVGWLCLHHTDPTRAWTSLSCGEDSLTKAFFDASVHLQLRDGATFLFWSDPWLEGARLTNLAPDLVAAVLNSGRWR
jgi:hypothetical protein